MTQRCSSPADILDALGPVDCGDGMTQTTRVIRRGTTITSRVDYGHLARVMMARRVLGLPEWPVVALTRPTTDDSMQDTNPSL